MVLFNQFEIYLKNKYGKDTDKYVKICDDGDYMVVKTLSGYRFDMLTTLFIHKEDIGLIQVLSCRIGVNDELAFRRELKNINKGLPFEGEVTYDNEDGLVYIKGTIYGEDEYDILPNYFKKMNVLDLTFTNFIKELRGSNVIKVLEYEGIQH